jgi:hypothetical protein
MPEDGSGRGEQKDSSVNQYFSSQVVAISTFGNREAGNPSKHWEFGRGGGDRTKGDVESA